MISSRGAIPSPLPPSTQLQFLAIVSTSHIPLQLAIGPSLEAWTPNERTESFFSDVLTRGNSHHATPSRRSRNSKKDWWARPSGQSEAGILASIPLVNTELYRGPKITEVFFYGVVEKQQLRVRALLLSSELLYPSGLNSTPPLSPVEPSINGATVEAQFLSHAWEDDTVHTVSSAKRKKMNDVFDQASERTRKARRTGGEGIAAAAAGSKNPANEHRRSISLDQKKLQAEFPDMTHSVPLVTTRPPSRSPSVSSDTRPISRKGFLDSKKSSLSRVTTAADDDEQSVETKNKEALSRLVMAGMRLYGMQQSKTNRSRKGSVAPSLADATNDMDSKAGDAAAKDEEYKLVFHQAYRCACVAFVSIPQCGYDSVRKLITRQRNHINTDPLYLHPDRLRDTVDEILAILCVDPITFPLSESHANQVAITPAGRAEKHGQVDLSFSVSASKKLTPDAAQRLNISTLEVRRSPLALKTSAQG